MTNHIGAYRVLQTIGRGGQGHVFKVADPTIPGKVWALKLVGDRRVFESEKKALEVIDGLHHPAFPRLANTFQWRDRFAIVLTHFEGSTAASFLPNKDSWRIALSVLHEVGDALLAIHEAGYLYLDLKPENVIFGSDGKRYLIDYSMVQSAKHARSTGVGTPGFAPPEQLSPGNPLHPSSDVYALGALGYFLLTGRSPDPRALPYLNSVPAGLEHLLKSALSLETSKRPRINSFIDYTTEAATREMQVCHSCGRENRAHIEKCARCDTRLSPYRSATPRMSQQERVLPPTQRLETTTESNDVLQELMHPTPRRMPRFRDLRLQAEDIAQIRGFDSLRAPTHLKHLITFYEHQEQAATQALQEMRGNAILADEVGLGKTIEAGLIAKELMLRGLVERVLVITPPHLVDQWVGEMNEKFDLPFKPYSDSSDWGKKHLIASQFAFRHPTNFRAISRLKHQYDLIIVDEMHNLLKLDGTPNAIYENLRRLPRKYLLLLSATPIRHHLKELYFLVTLINPGAFPNGVHDFNRRLEHFGTRSRSELKEELDRVMIRHHRRNLPEGALPPARQVIPVQLVPTAAEAQYMERAERLFLASRSAGLDSLSKIYSSPASQARLLGEQVPSLLCSKLTETRSILNKINDQAIVFTREPSTGDYLTRELRGSGFTVIQFGPGLSRQEKASRFYAFKRNARAVLVATDLAAEGRNLQFANNLINFDIPWNPLRLEQRIGRIDRLGQKRTPVIYNLYYPNTFEGAVYGVFDRGLRMFELIVGELATVMGELEEYGDGSLDKVLASIWQRDFNSPNALTRSLSTLSANLDRARNRYDSEKQTHDQIDRDLF